MNPLRCQEADELLPAYAADALERADQLDVASHLAECRRHDGALQALRQSFADLAAGVAPMDPPPNLKTSLLDAFDREVSGTAAPAGPATPVVRPVTARRSLPAAAWFGYAMAAALLAVAIGLGAWGASRGDGDGDIVVLAATSDAAGTLQLTYLPAHGLGVIEVDLEDLDAEHDYQAWRLDENGNAISLGVLPTTHGRVALDGDLTGATLVALSIEPAGGSPSPTSNPLLVTALN
jgi:anti-sigma-K factor RskA